MKMNILFVWSAFMGCVIQCLSQEELHNVRTVCGGTLRTDMTVSRSQHRILRVLLRSLYSARALSGNILSYYVSEMNIMDGDITVLDSACAGALVPDVVTFAESDVSTDISTDYRNVVSVLTALNFVRSENHVIHLDNEIHRLENVMYDVLCAMNNLGQVAGTSLPRTVHVLDITTPLHARVLTSGSYMTVSCDLGSLYTRIKLNSEIIRLSQLYFDNMFTRYINFN